MFVIATMLFIAVSGIVFYKLIAWNWEKRKMIHATRAVVEASSAQMPQEVATALRHALGMEPKQ